MLAEEDSISSLHCIGISVGSFAADACIKEFTRQRSRMSERMEKKEKLTTRLTLLCPFQQRGILGAGWGTKFFGKSAQYAEQYFISDDPVPGCNTPLKEAYCVDITEASERESYLPLPGDSDHAFPPYYYGKMIDASKVWGYFHDEPADAHAGKVTNRNRGYVELIT